MSNKENGGPAFPTVPGNYINENSLGEGMTLRDYFAAKALQGMCADPSTAGTRAKELVTECFQLADAMLEARKS